MLCFCCSENILDKRERLENECIFYEYTESDLELSKCIHRNLLIEKYESENFFRLKINR